MNKNYEILCTICARGGSKTVKNKNIVELDGKPLIAYTIKQALGWEKAKRVVCSTDSKKIAEIAKKYGATVPFMRPKELATDYSGKVEVVRHAARKCEEIFGEKYDIIIDLDVTSPIRTAQDLDSCLKIFLEKKPDVLFSVTQARRSPYFNMVEEKKDGFVKLVKSSGGKILRRQDSPIVYDVNASIYFYNRDFLFNEENDSVTSSDRVAIYEMGRNSIDLDEEIDLKFIEFLIERGVVNL